MNTLQTQSVRAVLDDLRVRIAPTLTDPTATATMGMAQYLIAHLMGRRESPGTNETIAEEMQRFDVEEQYENELINGKRAATSYQSLTVELIEPYMQQRLGNNKVRVTSIDATLGGFSKLTYVIQLTGADSIGNQLVIRRDPEFGPVEIHAAQEFPVLQVMHRHGVAVAEPLWADDATPYGGSFLVSRCARGASVYGKSALGIGANARPAALALARVIASIHRVPIAALGLPDDITRAPVHAHVARILDDMRDQWQRRRLQYSPTIDAALIWLRANIPQQGPGPVIVHGDASLRNFLVHEDRESALLDWELWHLGDPTEDLTLCKPEIDQIMSWGEFMAEYRAHGGCAYDEAIGDYYGLLIPGWQAMLTGCCIHGFEKSANPELRVAFAGSYHHRRLIRDVAKRLSVLS